VQLEASVVKPQWILKLGLKGSRDLCDPFSFCPVDAQAAGSRLAGAGPDTLQLGLREMNGSLRQNGKCLRGEGEVW
jgi:hypothetical protein